MDTTPQKRDFDEGLVSRFHSTKTIKDETETVRIRHWRGSRFMTAWDRSTLDSPRPLGLQRGLVWVLGSLGVLWSLNGAIALGQGYPSYSASQPFYQPLNQNMPPGVNAYWAGALGKATPPYFQPVRVDLPTEGRVTVYHGPVHTPYELNTSRPFAFLVGHTYRIRISGMPEYPGIELYPSVEVLDRLHPPPGQELNFPIPLQFTEAEINAALTGRLVTKVVFLEQPNLAPPREQEFPIPTPEFPTSVNILAEADRVGRPMAILRLGSRVPGAGGADAGFYGAGAPVYIPPPQPAEEAAPATEPPQADPQPEQPAT